MPSIDDQQRFLLVCLGTRGDVQPMIVLASGLLKEFPSCKVVISAHEEHEKFVKSHLPMDRTEYHLLTPSLIALLRETEDGRILKSSRNSYKVFKSLRALNKVMICGWFKSVIEACEQFKPTFMVIPTIGYYSDLQALARERFHIPFAVVNMVPAQPTSDFAPPSTGFGFTLAFGWMNKIFWTQSAVFAYKVVFGDAANLARKENGLKERTRSFLEETNQDMVQNICIYSNALLPRPAEWTSNHTVVGPLLPSSEEAVERIPQELTDFLDKNSTKPIIYIGLGSMLHVIFDSEAKILETLEKLIAGLILVQKSNSMAAILHIVAGNDSKATKAALLSTLQGCENIFLLDQPVAHSLLLPRVQLVVHHGGAGTTHASLIAGKPTIILPCGPTSDQPFWADVIASRIKAGPPGFAIDLLTPKRFADCLTKGLNFLDSYTVAAENVMKEMLEEQKTSLQSAVNVIKQLVSK